MNAIKVACAKLKKKAQDNKKGIILSLIAFVLFVFLFCESGYALYSFFSQRAKILLLIGVIGFALLLLCLLFDYRELLAKLKKPFLMLKAKVKFRYVLLDILKNISLEFYITFFFILCLLLSLLLNKNKDANINSYLMFLSIVFCAFILSKVFSLKQFSKAFVNIMVIICIVSSLTNLFYLISGVDLGNEILMTDDGSMGITSFFFFFIRNITNLGERMAGPFWEPGVYASMSLMAIVLYHFYVNKTKILIPSLLSIGILFSRSTAGIVLMALVWLILIFDFFKNKRVKIIIGILFLSLSLFMLLIIFSPPLLSFFAKLMPAIFSKFQTISFSCRYYSLIYGFKLFAQSPLFGLGFTTARETYFVITAADNVTVDAFTSTLGGLAAAYGLVGILIYLLPLVGLFLNKRLPLITKFLLGMFFLLTTMQETQVEIFMLFILYLMFGFDGINQRFRKHDVVSLFTPDESRKSLFNLFFKKNENGNVSSNLALNTVIKALSLLIGFITISIYSGYFGNKNAYGIWLSIVSISTWILQLDFGFGNGLRNKLTEARIQGDKKKEQSIISSTYLITLSMSAVWIVVSFVLCNTLDLFSIFKASTDYVSAQTLKVSVLIVLISIALELSLRNITYVLQVIGKSGIASSLTLISNILILVFASVVRINGEAKFIVLATVYSACILLPLILASFVVFVRKEVPFINFKTITKSSIRSISKLGIGFFIVQLSNLLLWSLNDVLLINLFNRPDVVVDYTEYYKIFTAVTGLAGILQGPIWVGISEAKEQKDLPKLKRFIKVDLFFCGFLAFCSVILAIALPLVFRVWLGEDNMPAVTPLYIIIMLVYSLVALGYEFFALICNGLGAVKSQAIIAGTVAVLKVPLTLLLNFLWGGTLNWSVVILTNTILIAVYLVALPFVVKKEMHRMKTETAKAISSVEVAK